MVNFWIFKNVSAIHFIYSLKVLSLSFSLRSPNLEAPNGISSETGSSFYMIQLFWSFSICFNLRVDSLPNWWSSLINSYEVAKSSLPELSFMFIYILLYNNDGLRLAAMPKSGFVTVSLRAFNALNKLGELLQNDF